MTPDNADTARHLLAAFAPEGDAHIVRRLSDGEDPVFEVAWRADRFVLRRTPARLSTSAIRLQSRWLRAIGATGRLIVPTPHPTTSGEAFTVDPADGRRWTLLGWVEGEPIADAEAFAAPAVLECVGEAVGHLHTCAVADIAAAPAIDADALVGRGPCLGDGSAARLLSPGDLATLTTVAAQIADAFARLEALPGACGLIHADLAPANWLFGTDGSPRLIDSDQFGRGPRLFDLLGVLWSHLAWDEYDAMRDALLRGYERVRPIPPPARDVLGPLAAATAFPWLNRGCRLADPAARDAFLEWVPATVAAIGRRCADGG